MYVLSDDDMVSHCFWKNNSSILAFENKKKGGPGYYLMKDKTDEYIHCWPQFSNDGHPSYSPDGKLIVTDSYPDRTRVASINVMDGDERKLKSTTVARVFAPFKYDNDVRCDLHPRWNRAGNRVCFDSVFEDHRGLYVVNLIEQMKEEKYTIIYVFTSCKRSGPVQIMYNLIKNIDRNLYNPILITLYDEVVGESDLDKFISIGVKHYHVPLGKKDIILNKTDSLKELLLELKPSIIHSMGVFPDYAVSRMMFNCQVMTLHNYMHDDFCAKYGKVKGIILEALQMSAVKKAAKVWTCSESLAQIYEKKNKLYFDYIRNGVDVSKYSRVKNNKEKIILRQKLKLPIEKTIFIYTGQFIERKDQEFLLEIFSKKSELENFVLLMLGDGENFKVQKKQFERNTNIIFAGNVDNVEEYLKASDYYISSSRSEGLPTSVLEAMSAGLPVILSNITQHKELMGINNQIGIMYELGNQTDCVKKILEILGKDRNELSNAAYICVHTSLNATTMSQKYQDEYMNVIKKNAGVLV
jgi:glycosyltransferase involved in cell wall biosynthesis